MAGRGPFRSRTMDGPPDRWRRRGVLDADAGHRLRHRPAPIRASCWLTLTLVILGVLCGWAEGSSGCKVDHCTRQFQQAALSSNGRRAGPSSPTFCVFLREYSDCLRSTARSCRGHLAYHSTITLVQNWNGDANCTFHAPAAAAAAPTPASPGDRHVHGSKGRHNNNHNSNNNNNNNNHNGEEYESKTHHLEPTARVYSTRPERPSVTTASATSSAKIAAAAACTYQGRSEATYCSFYGDPHLTTFGGEFQTCKVAGAWPLIDNAYLAVSVTNEAVVPGSAATATTKITIIIKGGSDCAPERTYEAAVDAVPASFVDGSQWSGPAPTSELSASVRIVEKEAGRHVEIQARHLGAVLIVRQVGRYLTFAARMPRDVAEQGATREGLQLCVKGCPVSERIDLAGHHGAGAWDAASAVGGRFHRQSDGHRGGHHGAAGQQQRAAVHQLGMKADAALALCREYNLTDYYLDSCIFDLTTTGDPSFSLAAHRAQTDFVALMPDAHRRLANRTWPLTPSTSSSPSSASQSAAASASSALIREVHGPGRPALVLLAAVAVLSLVNSPW